MTVLLLILAGMLFGTLVLITAVTPIRSTLSPFELKRRGDASALDIRRENDSQDIESLRRVISALLLVVITTILITACDWPIGIPLALLGALTYGRFARSKAVHSYAQRQYGAIEIKLLDFVEQRSGTLRWIRWTAQDAQNSRIDSKEELIDVIKRSSGVLHADEKRMIESALAFSERLVSDIMTPKSVMVTIQKGEVMGPLVLDDLHKTGHSRFPVIDGDIDHVIGMLYVRDVLTIDTTKKTTSKVETVMDKNVFFIHEDQTLGEALPAFLSTHHHLFIVINQYRETVGLLALEDVLETMIGRTIIDEYDTHDDMRKVAERVSRRNNRTDTSTDV